MDDAHCHLAEFFLPLLVNCGCRGVVESVEDGENEVCCLGHHFGMGNGEVQNEGEKLGPLVRDGRGKAGLIARRGQYGIDIMKTRYCLRME